MCAWQVQSCTGTRDCFWLQLRPIPIEEDSILSQCLPIGPSILFRLFLRILGNPCFICKSLVILTTAIPESMAILWENSREYRLCCHKTFQGSSKHIQTEFYVCTHVYIRVRRERSENVLRKRIIPVSMSLRFPSKTTRHVFHRYSIPSAFRLCNETSP